MSRQPSKKTRTIRKRRNNPFPRTRRRNINGTNTRTINKNIQKIRQKSLKQPLHPLYTMSTFNDDDIPTFKRRKGTATVKHRKYRADKRNPKGIEVTIREDLGKVEQTQQYFFKGTHQGRTKKKEKNPNLIYLLKSPIKIGYYTNTKKCFVWQQNGLYSGELEKHDLKRLFSAIGHILRKPKK